MTLVKKILQRNNKSKKKKEKWNLYNKNILPYIDINRHHLNLTSDILGNAKKKKQTKICCSDNRITRSLLRLLTV